ncbi:MAG: ketoacyl-ACP synthase III [Myxococcota bacterium]
MRHAVLRASAIHLPDREVTADEYRERLADIAPTFVDKMIKKTGVKNRFYAPDDWATSDLVVAAAQKVLERADVSPESIDLLVVGTDSPDYITPSTSVVAQKKLGLVNAGTFDVVCACASFPTGLGNVAGLMAVNPTIKRVLVVGAYMMRKYADPKDPMSYFYGDGAGAVLVEAAEEPGVLGVSLRADGSFVQNWGIFAGGTAEPISVDAIENGRHQVRMHEGYPPHVNNDGWPLLVRRLAEEQKFSVNDIDLLIFTQFNRSAIEAAMGSLELPMERTHMVMDRFGYTGSACIPMALHDAVEAGRVKSGDLVVMCGTGVGFNQAAVAVRITDRFLRD